MHILLNHQAFAALNETGDPHHHELIRHLARHGQRVTIIASAVRYLSGTGSRARVRLRTADLGDVLDAAELLRDRPETRIVLLGSGKEKSRLRSEADQRQLAQVMFLPLVPKLKMAEPLAACRPVILAMDGVIQQVVEEAQAGVCVPPGDSQALVSTIKELATNKQKCRTMGLNGRKMIQSGYSREDVANRFAAILETMRSKKDG